MFKTSSFSIFSSTLDINFLSFSHFDGGVMLFHCSFHLYFLKKHLLSLLSTNYVPGLDLGGKAGW